jgi:hypothetical protein
MVLLPEKDGVKTEKEITRIRQSGHLIVQVIFTQLLSGAE